MLDIFGMVAALNRPSLLVRTARFGVDDYKRTIHLPRILRSPSLPKCSEALVKLLELERRMNEYRIAARAEYSIAKHVEFLSLSWQKPATYAPMQNPAAFEALRG